MGDSDGDRPRSRGRAARDAQLVRASQLLDSAVDTMRRIISDLRPSVLDHLGVWTAIEWYAGQIEERTGLPCKVSISAEVAAIEVDPERATAMFRIVQEALTNFVRHARASRAEIRIRREAGAVMIAVEDDGVGIADDALIKTESWGLLGMQERAARFGGNITLSRGVKEGHHPCIAHAGLRGDERTQAPGPAGR
jgi:two-component system sensor histidine kinase UhpB